MKEGYSICFNEWALDKNIKDELGLLLIISSLTAEKGYCYASNDYLAKIFETSVVTISRKIKILEEKKYIKIEYEKKGCLVISRKIRLTKMLTAIINSNANSNAKNNEEIDIDIRDRDKSIDKDINIENNNNNNNYNYIYNNSSSSDEIINFIENNFGRTLSSYEFEKINCWLNEFNSDIVKHAIELSILNNKRIFAYIEGILKNWKSCGYKTLDDIKNEDVTPKHKTKEELKKEYAKMGYIYE